MEEGGEDEEEAGNGMVGPGCQWDGWGCEIWRDVCGCVWAVGLWGPHGIDLAGPRRLFLGWAGLGWARPITQ